MVLHAPSWLDEEMTLSAIPQFAARRAIPEPELQALWIEYKKANCLDRWLSPAVFVLGSLLGTAAPALAQCAEPVAPAGINGATATNEQMKIALANVSNFIAQSDAFQTCLVNAFEAAKAQAAANQQPFDTSIEQTAEGLIEANQRLKESVGNAVNAALSDFKNSHGVAQGPPNNGVAGASDGVIREAGQYNLFVERDLANCIDFIQPPGRYAAGIALSLHNTCGMWRQKTSATSICKRPRRRRSKA